MKIENRHGSGKIIVFILLTLLALSSLGNISSISAQIKQVVDQNSTKAVSQFPILEASAYSAPSTSGSQALVTSSNSQGSNMSLDANISLPAHMPVGFSKVYNSTDSAPHLAGWMTGNHFGVPAVEVTVSPSGTTSAEIQSSNRLMMGVWDVVFSSTVSGRDYGYTFLVAIPGTGSPYLIAEADQFCEGFIFTQCGAFPSEKTLFYATGGISLGPYDDVTLELSFSGTTVYWSYNINGGSWNTFAGFGVPSDSQTVFQVGTYTAFNGHTAKYFQFGIASDSGIGNTGWESYVYNPQYLSGGSWTNVPTADFAQGPNAFLDARWVWGGQTFTDASACYADNGSCQFPIYNILFYSSTSTISDGTRIWG